MKPKTIDIKGKQYVQVNERVKEAHAANKQISITTEVLQHTPLVVMKATVTTVKGTFTGTSFANVSKSIEKTSPYEVAETSAVGRALGFAGYGIVDSIASADEINKSIIHRDDEPFPSKNTLTNYDRPITEGITLISNED